jgi:hypothetical protein
MHAEKDQTAAVTAAVGWAAYLTLRDLHPRDTEALNVAIKNYNTLLNGIFVNPIALFAGVRWGGTVAKTVKSSRTGDGSGNPGADAFVVRCSFPMSLQFQS